MRKKTSTIIGLAIATILTAYVSALTFSNQAFAQSVQDKLAQLQAQGSSVDIAKMFDMQIAANQLAQSSHNTPQQQESTNALGLGIGPEAQLGKILEGQQGSHPSLGASQCPNLSPANQLTPSGAVGRCTSY